MIKPLKITIAFLLLFFSTFIFSQILTINNNATITLDSGSSISIDGLIVAPSQTYIISGSDEINRFQEPIIENGNSSIDRVFTTSSFFSEFSGTLIFSYLEEELNEIEEDDLVIELQGSDGNWTSYPAEKDFTTNTISFTFLTPVTFKAITASKSGQTLTVERKNSSNLAISVYPNPVADRLFIQANEGFHAELFTVLGKKVLRTEQSQIDIKTLENGIYILNITTDNNHQTFFKIIKK